MRFKWMIRHRFSFLSWLELCLISRSWKKIDVQHPFAFSPPFCLIQSSGCQTKKRFTRKEPVLVHVPLMFLLWLKFFPGTLSYLGATRQRLISGGLDSKGAVADTYGYQARTNRTPLYNSHLPL